MKGVLAWVRSHLLIVISAVLIVVLLPAGFVGASMWNTSIRTSAEKAFKDEERKLTQQEKVQYVLPAVLEGEAAMERSQAPNPRVTAFYQRERQAREEQVGRIVDLATELNRDGHAPLVEGLFPEAASPRIRAELARELARRMAAPEGGADAYDNLLRRLGAGSPPEPEDVAAILNDAEQRARDQQGVTASTDRLSPEQEQGLREELAQQRVTLYAARAGDLTFYASPGLFAPRATAGVAASALPTPEAARGTPTEAETFAWQWDYWVAEDVLRAVALANSEGGVPLGVPDAPVKRVDSLSVSPLRLAAAATDEFGAAAGRASPGLPPTYTRRTSAPSEDFDVRMVRLEAIVDPATLPRFFNALARTNYMTVTDLDLQTIDPWDDLAAGYYFGQGPLALASMQIETVWLRSWTAPLMPPSVRQGLGIVVPAGEAEGEEGFEQEP